MRAAWMVVAAMVADVAVAAPCGTLDGVALACGAQATASVLSTQGSDVAGFPVCDPAAYGRAERVHAISCTQPGPVLVTVTPGSCPLDVFALEGASCDTDGCVQASTAVGLAAESVVVDCAPGAPGYVVVEQDPRVAFGSACSTALSWGYTIATSCAVVCDEDADGFDALACGGLDCDDADPAVFPGAVDVLGDGLDADCDGVDDGPPVLSGPVPLVAGLRNVVEAATVTPGAGVLLAVAGAPGTTPVPWCPGLSVDLDHATALGFAVASPAGVATWPVTPPLWTAGRPWGFQAVDLVACRVTQVAVVPITR